MKVVPIDHQIIQREPAYKLGFGVYRLASDNRVIVIDPVTLQAVAIQTNEPLFQKKMKENQ